MADMRVTRGDCLIGLIGIGPAIAASSWRLEIAAWAHVAPKLISAAGFTISVGVVLFLAKLTKRWVDGRTPSVPAKYRLIGLALLVIGAAYFWTREEIAGAIGLPLRIGDALMTFAFVVASLRLVYDVAGANDAVGP